MGRRLSLPTIDYILSPRIGNIRPVPESTERPISDADRSGSHSGPDTAEAALAALTIEAARLAGAADRIGSLETGKVANVVVTSGDLFDGGQVRHVFVDGYPVEITPPAPAQGGGRRGGGSGLRR